MQQLVSEFLDSLKNKKYSPNSIQSHRLDLRKFLKWLKVDENNYDSQELLEKIRNLNLEDLEIYLNYLGQSYKPRTLARHTSTLKLFLDRLELQGLIKKSPAHQLRFPEVMPDAPEILSPEEVVALQFDVGCKFERARYETKSVTHTHSAIHQSNQPLCTTWFERKPSQPTSFRSQMQGKRLKTTGQSGRKAKKEGM